MSRLKALYKESVQQQLKDDLNSPNIMAVPRLTKITLNMVMGRNRIIGVKANEESARVIPNFSQAPRPPQHLPAPRH